MATKKPTIEITEILKRPFESDSIPEFKIAEGSSVPIFENAMEQLKEFHELSRELMNEEDIVVFWGFSGILMNKYSRVKTKDGDSLATPQSLEIKISLTKPGQNMTVYRESAWEIAMERMEGIENISPIDFKTAMLMLEGKIKPPEEEYQEPDEDEFDENCTPECVPGDHKCGKK